jgi:hypothetical protein
VNDLLLLIAVAVPCWYVYQRSVSHGLVQIDHVGTFTFGFLFYWITPLFVRIYVAKLDFPLAATWSALFREKLITPYALSCISLYLCFALGDSLGLRLFHANPARKASPVPKLALSLATLAGCVLLLYTAFVFRAALSRPASPTDVATETARGAVTTCMILLGVVSLLFTVDRPQMPWRRRLGSGYFLTFIAGAGFMLWLGSRLYVASFLIMFAVYQSNFRKPFKLTTVIAGGLVLALLFGALGMWREHGDMTGALFNVVEEPMLNSLSLVHHLRYKGISWFNTPNQLGSDFLNLVPTLLLPNKAAILKKPEAFRPLGGLNSFVSFDLNFGVGGSAVFLFLWPIAFRYLRSRSTSTVFATMYIMCSGWLAFTFFRDPFSISLVKAILQDSILMPAVVVGFGWLLSAACSPRDEVLTTFSGPRLESL